MASEHDEQHRFNVKEGVQQGNQVKKTTESIRKQLAGAGGAGGGRAEVSDVEEEGKYSLICFMNEALLEEEQLEKSGEIRDLEFKQCSTEQWSAQYIAKNNISKKKNHVIVPLTPNGTSERTILDPPEEEEKDLIPIERRLGAYLYQIRLEARQRLKKAKEEAREAMNREQREQQRSIIAELNQQFGVKTASRRLTRHMLTDMNRGQLQVILNYLLSRIQELNEKLVKDLMVRDELVMEQDSLLTDIEDITKGINVS